MCIDHAMLALDGTKTKAKLGTGTLPDGSLSTNGCYPFGLLGREDCSMTGRPMVYAKMYTKERRRLLPKI
ncbi:hypothetical protein M109_1796 [Bacteroides fragilis str. 3397 N2]|nr:hypothetical protein M109_1796 [Bacteroides fragilis str. 3397 N2]